MIYEESLARKLVLDAGMYMIEKGLIARTWGNISAKISEDTFVITPSGRAYETLKPEDLVEVRIKDASYDGAIKPSSEKGLHAAIYRLKPEAGFLIHTHQNFASALSVLGKDLDFAKLPVRVATKEEKDTLGSAIPCAEYGMFSTDELAQNVCDAAARFEDAKSVLMKSHGTMCFGSTQEEAYAVAEALESVSKKITQRLLTEKAASVSEHDAFFTAARACLTDETGETHTNGTRVMAKTPYIHAFSKLGKEMKPYLDDQAQIIGVRVACVESVADAENAFGENNAVFVKGEGAVCKAANAEEAEVAAIVLEKGCLAAIVAEAEGADPLPAEIAREERDVYTKSYSKQKDA